VVILTVSGSTAASAVFIGASPMNVFEPERRARRPAQRAGARVLPETAESLTREVYKLGDVGIGPFGVRRLDAAFLRDGKQRKRCQAGALQNLSCPLEVDGLFHFFAQALMHGASQRGVFQEHTLRMVVR